jgi:hypothetical protein
MKVYVVMGNDFPEAVFSKEKDAEAFCAEKVGKKPHKGLPAAHVHWRTYEFKLDREVK